MTSSRLSQNANGSGKVQENVISSGNQQKKKKKICVFLENGKNKRSMDNFPHYNSVNFFDYGYDAPPTISLVLC